MQMGGSIFRKWVGQHFANGWVKPSANDQYRWVKDKYFANEALDCAVGNLAAFEIEGYKRWSEEH
ncbi:MAG: hypothetical protein H6618_04880 [Deltaproteobacteria bacterium]|nr:hypothetical protein [Deltaproteobacteria bacterium]